MLWTRDGKNRLVRKGRERRGVEKGRLGETRERDRGSAVGRAGAVFMTSVYAVELFGESCHKRIVLVVIAR